MNFNFEYLKHGKALCGKAFKRFVETFNFHNDFISNLKGDADIPTDGGHIYLDTTDPSHPVVRCAGCEGSSGGGGGSYVPAPSPFEFTLATPDPEEGEDEEPTGTPAIVNNTFYWDGVLKSLPDFTPPATCTVYLCCTQDAPSSSHPDPDWEFEIATSESEAPSGGRAVNYKLYDIANNAVTMDYRTTFLAIESPHEKAQFVVRKPYSSEAANQSVIISAYNEKQAIITISSGGTFNYSKSEARENYSRQTISADSTKYVIIEANKIASVSSVEIKNGDRSIKLSTADLDNTRKDIKFHTLTVKDADGGEEKFIVLADSDIEIFRAKGTVLKDVELKYEDYSLQMKKTTIDLSSGEETEGEFETVFDTEPHSAQ